MNFGNVEYDHIITKKTLISEKRANSVVNLAEVRLDS